ncbi:hypothetical protein N3K66_004738 [Trichothecium roseum]|uniref:Uncharacterized protein n=1 Tax=Trichothecium roseum TaxID=47278 RepID=A0ACC0V2V7_9HYPO|nr:hypothetical protein N3K66_004738 [Trichothecium roseum]
MWSTTSPTRQRNDEESAAAVTDSSSDAYSPEKPQRQPLPDDDDPDPPPDGGRQAWTQVLCMHLVFLNTWGVSNGYGVFQRYYLSRFPSSSPSAVSWVGSIQVFLVFFVGVLAGRLSDAGHFRPVFAAGVALQVLGLVTASFATAYWQVLLSHAVCLGVGNGLAFCPALAVLSQYFRRKRAFSVGLASAGAAVGGLVYPVMVDRLVDDPAAGYPWAMRAMAFIMFATYIPCLVLMKPRITPDRSAAGSNNTTERRPWLDTSALREPSFVFFSLCFFLCFWGLYFPFFYLGTYALEVVHIARPVNLVMVLNGVGVVGRIIPPLVADRVTGLLNLLIVFSLASAALVYAWAAVGSSAAGLYVFAVCNGLLAASLQSLLPAAATTMAPDPKRAGTRIGMILCFVSFANLTGPAICGEIIKRMGGAYLGAQMFAGSSILLGALMAVAARVAKAGAQVKVKV